MRLRRLRNLAFILTVASGLLAGTAARANSGCYECDFSWGDFTWYCYNAPYGSIGRTQCVDINQGYDDCDTGGENCTLPVPN